MAPIVAALVKWGLPMIASVVASKGKEVVEKKLGVDLDSMLGSEEGRIRLKQLEMQHEEFLLNITLEEKKVDNAAEQVAQTNVTDRWKADMSSDSWLSKNVRPVILLYLTGCVTIMAFLSGVSMTFKVADKWIDLLETVLVIVFSAYFVGRTAEKGVNVWRRK